MIGLKSRYVWGGVAIAILFLLAAGAWGIWRNQPQMLTGGLGADFNLTDNRGQPITQEAFKGHPSMLFFGYTHCPDVCPTTLYEMAGWFKTLGEEGKALRGYYMTVDPQRDSVETMNDYVTALSDRITGITGDPAEIAKVIKGWRIYAAKVPGEGDDYTMDHTASVFLLDENGAFKGTISYGEKADVAIEKLRNLLKGH
jgi:protein SCO1